EERRVRFLPAGVGQKAKGGGRDSTTGRADLNLAATQVVEAAQRLFLPVEEPHGLVIEATEGEKSMGRRGFGGAALDETRHGLAARQALQRFHRPGAGLDLDGEAVRGRHLAGLAREEVVPAAFAAGAERDDTRRHR